MALSYLNNKKWSQITREERVFCFELYNALIDAPKPFLNHLSEKELKNVEFGIEVCFYRDLLHELQKNKQESKLPLKRTFDLVLFSETEIIIIEAKASQGFNKKQLASFEQDVKEHLPNLFKEITDKPIKFSTMAIYSSNYSPKKDTLSYFDVTITWKDLANKYPSKKEIFNRADEIYKIE